MDKARILNTIRPGAQWTIRGGVVTWHDKKSVEPTEQEYVDGERVVLIADKIANIKREASRRICAILPAWKQMNMLARATELAHRGAMGVITENESEELALMQVKWDEITEIRNASDMIELSLQNLSAELVEAYNVAADPAWPPA